ncbi:cupin domain-containing protein [bacterium]|nr:cupin domain-containing protein [bacterium]
MIVKQYTDVEATEVEQGAQGVKIRWVINKEDGAANFAMRHFEIAPGGYTPHHAHPWEHEVFIISGDGTVAAPDGDKPLSAGSVVFVPGGEEHHFTNTGEEPLAMLCLVPFLDQCCC